MQLIPIINNDNRFLLIVLLKFFLDSGQDIFLWSTLNNMPFLERWDTMNKFILTLEYYFLRWRDNLEHKSLYWRWWSCCKGIDILVFKLPDSIDYLIIKTIYILWHYFIILINNNNVIVWSILIKLIDRHYIDTIIYKSKLWSCLLLKYIIRFNDCDYFPFHTKIFSDQSLYPCLARTCRNHNNFEWLMYW